MPPVNFNFLGWIFSRQTSGFLYGWDAEIGLRFDNVNIIICIRFLHTINLLELFELHGALYPFVYFFAYTTRQVF